MNTPGEHTQNIIRDYFGAGAGEAVMQRLETVSLAGGDWLFRQGDPGDSLYFLVRGRLQVWLDSSSGEPRLLGEVAPGESVGEVGLLTGEARSAGIRAIRDSRLIRLGRDAFEALAAEHPALVMKLAANMAQLVQKGNQRAAAARKLSTIALLPLSGDPTVGAFCDDLCQSLESMASAVRLQRGELGHAGAPVDALEENDPVPEAVLPWLHSLEDEHRFVIYQCDPAATPWTRLALRQADIVLFICESTGDVSWRDWERELELDGGQPAARPTLVLLHSDPAAPIAGTRTWLEARQPEFHLHVRAGRPDDVARVARTIAGSAVGLVLAGGAARGIAHLGVFKAMRELGIPVDWIGGVSIGSILGAGMAMDLGIEETIASARAALVGQKPFSDYTLPIISLTRGRRMDRILAEYFGQDIEDLPLPFFCISCTLDDGALNVHEHGPTATALRASASMPGIFPPAVVDRRLTVDGSVINNMPVDVMQQKPVGQVIAVDLSSQKTYEVPYDSVPSPWAVLRGQWLPFTRRHRVPGLMTTLLKGTELGTLARAQELGRQADLLLHPPVRKFGMTEVKAFDRMVEDSYRYTLEELSRWWETSGR
ncbi:MAG: cyclic nucleotide-binding domain-containing protein [Xanthomonadales bacterium]|nr:cyclic nucleotide-binding domain-containing protein [Xanthomonadales bacterium]